MENLNWFWWIIIYLVSCLFIGFPLAVTACSVRNVWSNPMINGWRDHLIMILCFPTTFLSEAMLSILGKDRSSPERDDMPGFIASVVEDDDAYILITSLLWLPKTVWVVCIAPPALLMIGAIFCISHVKRFWKKNKKEV